MAKPDRDRRVVCETRILLFDVTHTIKGNSVAISYYKSKNYYYLVIRGRFEHLRPSNDEINLKKVK